MQFVIERLVFGGLVFVEFLFEQVELGLSVGLQLFEFVFLRLDFLDIGLVFLFLHEHHFILGAGRVFNFVEVWVHVLFQFPEDETAILGRRQHVDAVFG